MKNVLLVFGGKSYEHDISVVTASQIYKKTRCDEIKLIPLYISRENEFYLYLDKEFSIKNFSMNNFQSNKRKLKRVVFVSGESNKLFVKSWFGLKEYMSIDNAIFCCHGGCGENGKLVSYFNLFGFGTSAGNVSALSVCMDKFLFKQMMRGMRIPVVSGFKITLNEYENFYDKITRKIQFLKFPVIIKSNHGGSSIGLFVAKTREDFDKNLKLAFEFDDEVLVEKFIVGAREFNIAVLGSRDEFEISRIDEPLKMNEVLSFADKYLNGDKVKGIKNSNKTGSMASSARKNPLDLNDEITLKIKKYAQEIFVKLGLCGVVRIDFLFDKNSQKIYVCEVNAIPGSLAYYLFDDNKISTNSLVKELLKVAENNRKNLNDVKKEYLTNILD